MVSVTKTRLTKNQKRRQKKRENKKLGVVVDAKEEKSIKTVTIPTEENVSMVDEEPSEVEYVYDSAFEKVKDQYSELEEVFKKFHMKEESQRSEMAASTSQNDAVGEGGKVTERQEETAENLMNADNEPEKKKLSKKARKLAGRLTVAELKALVKRPDVVEVHDVTAADPRLLVFLKSYRNAVPVPAHWCQKRRFLSGRRGVEKPQFKLPDYIAKTGIAEIRAAITEEEREKSVQSMARDRMHPQLHRMDIRYEVLEDAFFKNATKPKMTGFGEVYYEGKEYEVRLTEKKPGQLSDKLREALGMTPLSPPPWLWSQQRYGPPPSYPNLRIPGLNSPIPPGCTYGNHVEGWGRPPMDQFGRPLYGDVYGTYKEEKEVKRIDPEKVPLWGELPKEDYGDTEVDDIPQEKPQRIEEEKEEAVPDLGGIESVIPGMETPAAVQLRKEAGDETPYEPKSLYTRLEEKEVNDDNGLLPSTKRYVMPGKK